jgi:hypothetical protein
MEYISKDPANQRQNSILIQMQFLPNEPPFLRRSPMIPLSTYTFKRMKQHSSIEESI